MSFGSDLSPDVYLLAHQQLPERLKKTADLFVFFQFNAPVSGASTLISGKLWGFPGLRKQKS
jgi:hypothetical protein